MNTKPVDPNRRLDTLFPSPWLRAAHLLEHHRPQVTLTVKDLRIVTVQPKPNQEEDKPALFFAETELGYLLNKTDAQALAGAGLSTVADVIGAKVVISLETFRGKNVLRIKSAARPQPAPQPAPQPVVQPPAAAAPPPATAATGGEEEPTTTATSGEEEPATAATNGATGTPTAFWKLARQHADRIDRPTALAIIAAFPDDWPGAVAALEEIIAQPA